MTTNFDGLKRRVGKRVFSEFTQLVAKNDKLSDARFQATAIKHAAELAEEKPFVTLAFRDNGIIKDSHKELIYVFRPNLWAQDFAHEEGSLDKMNVYTAAERGVASAKFAYENYPGLRELLKRRGKSEKDFSTSMMEAALIEAAYYSRIGGMKMDADSARKIDIAIMKRYVKKESSFRTIMTKLGIDHDDTLALSQIAETIDLSGCLQEVSEIDPYFTRRTDLIDEYRMFAKMDAEKSVKIAALQSDAFTRELFSRVLKRKQAEPWLVRAVMDLFRDLAS
ncbi:hypothetical protein I532_04225 [Brevibacillus borstelensis AK1]|uniref:Uncharacterized protein n=1 Tax=Brevibacillus borstelensis AK1 TaxID=1300222 RepID=M8DMB7_9BACL|nr:hypothetical protein [Brevibacillus borstelensis]EMT54783.1 hypothetical protein I532_04225 [Brevibacillus borstelensis AK1]